MTLRSWWNPEPAIREIDRAAHHAEQRMGEAWHRAAQARVPFNTGKLANSGEVAEDDGDVVVRYSADHARFVHAHPERTFQHGRSGHWLEEAIDAAEGDMESAMIETMRADWPS